MRISAARAILAIVLLQALALVACRDSGVAPAGAPATASANPPIARPAPPAEGARHRDLSIDESMGGHTLARHVGKTDADLVERLRREPQIASAATYSDRATAERVVGMALASTGKLEAWRARTGRRPNLALHYSDRSSEPIGRSLSRGQTQSVPCRRAVIVLRWDERRDRFYVLTSYPEADR